jgi:hypothetical protein
MSNHVKSCEISLKIGKIEAHHGDFTSNSASGLDVLDMLVRRWHLQNAEKYARRIGVYGI